MQPDAERCYSSVAHQPRFSVGEDEMYLREEAPHLYSSTDNFDLMSPLYNVGRQCHPMQHYYNGNQYKEKLLSDSSFEVEIPKNVQSYGQEVCGDCMQQRSLSDFYTMQEYDDVRPSNRQCNGRRSLPQLNQVRARRKQLPSTPPKHKHRYRKYSGPHLSPGQYYDQTAATLPSNPWKNPDNIDPKFVFTNRDDRRPRQPEHSDFIQVNHLSEKSVADVESSFPYSQNEYADRRPSFVEGQQNNYHSQEDSLPLVDSRTRSPSRKYAPRRILPDISMAIKRRARPENLENINRPPSFAMRDLSKSEFQCENVNRSGETFEIGHSDEDFSDLEEQYCRGIYQSTNFVRKTSLPKSPFSRPPSDKFSPSKSKPTSFYASENMFDSPANSSPLEYDSEDSRRELRRDLSRSRLSKEDRFLIRNIRSPLSSPDDNPSLSREACQSNQAFDDHSQSYPHRQNGHRKYSHLRSKHPLMETWT